MKGEEGVESLFAYIRALVDPSLPEVMQFLQEHGIELHLPAERYYAMYYIFTMVTLKNALGKPQRLTTREEQQAFDAFKGRLYAVEEELVQGGALKKLTRSLGECSEGQVHFLRDYSFHVLLYFEFVLS